MTDVVDRFVPTNELPEAFKEAATLPSVTLDEWSLSDLELIAIGGFSPLEGFMGSADYKSVLEHMHLATGGPWPIPITLATHEDVSGLREGQKIALRGPTGAFMGTLALREKYAPDKQREAQLVYRTTETAHPGVAKLQAQGKTLLAGEVHVFQRMPRNFPDLPDEPKVTRRIFKEKGWSTVVGFQTRNPVHRAHEYIQKAATESVDGLFLQPLVGQTKGDDIPATVRVKSYKVLLEKYYHPNRVVLGAYPAAMRYAGPREAVLHALVRKNYGCTHFIVGRDHAGVGKYYGTYDAQHIFKEFAPGELGITPMFFENAFFCRTCANMASEKTCPHPAKDRLNLSGTQVRDLLRMGEMLPPEFSRPEVAKVLMENLAEPDHWSWGGRA